MIMEGNSPDRSSHLGVELERPPKPRHTRSRSQGSDNDNTRKHTRYSRQANGRVSRQPSHLRAGYASHIRSTSRVSWDGRVALPDADSRTHSPSPPHSPVRRSHRPRPLSAISVPEHSFGRPTVLTDRWSYDRERMPSPHGSRPGTPTPRSERQSFEAGFSRPASIFTESRPSSRPPSILLTDMSSSIQLPSTPTLRVMPPPDPGHEGNKPGKKLKEEPYHLLTSEELEMLSHPPPLHPPMSASPLTTPPTSPWASPLASPATSPLASPVWRAPKLSSEISRLGPPKQKVPGHASPGPHESEEEHDKKSGCMGICEIATARRIGGTFGAWFMGMVIPVTFGLVTGCVAAVTGCK